MRDPKGQQCPECGAPRGADNTPSCGCTRRASDALRDARTAEQAAAEDFDPLRIRPYVELEGDNGTAEHPAASPAPAPPALAPPAPAPVPAAEATMPLRTVSPEAPSADDLRLFEQAPAGGRYDEAVRPRGRGRTVLLGVGGAVVAVVAAAGLASGMFSYEKPSRESALPDDIRASVPDASTGPASAPPSRTGAAPSLRPPAPPVPPVSASPSPSASPSATSASPSPSRSAEPTRSAPSAGATSSTGASDNSRKAPPPVLRRGSEGAEVTELELRLTQLGLYPSKASGHYNEGVEDAVSRYQLARGLQQDGLGVYGAETRSRLESETTDP
ncbi:peptidoglycan-binding domain-containing protein [Streptomyces sp. NBC_00078]|uniref:peptidoglycan-binding domain-containing protein n=1 Tax=unclassified Streptomyces TaxID=2593676 RepID=UPI00225A7CBF|nr:peptidoglycan-binding domain-containing protein [Streptomyces sp. NBC_00078]MCX5420479.1 peptidoglycan-binding protein [Streptomyces sp. NBC_00078]